MIFKGNISLMIIVQREIKLILIDQAVNWFMILYVVHYTTVSISGGFSFKKQSIFILQHGGQNGQQPALIWLSTPSPPPPYLLPPSETYPRLSPAALFHFLQHILRSSSLSLDGGAEVMAAVACLQLTNIALSLILTPCIIYALIITGYGPKTYQLQNAVRNVNVQQLACAS